MSKLKYTFTVEVAHEVTDQDLADAGEALELGRPALIEEYLEDQKDLMADDGPEFLDAWMEDGKLECKVEIVT